LIIVSAFLARIIALSTDLGSPNSTKANKFPSFFLFGYYLPFLILIYSTIPHSLSSKNYLICYSFNAATGCNQIVLSILSSLTT